MDQEKIDLNSLKTVKQQLSNKKLLKNSNPGVQAFVSACLADVLRVYAPDAPFNAQTLADIFRCFISQIKRLDDVENAYYPQRLHLLQRLAEVRSIVLLTDLPDSEKLISGLFDACYSVEVPQRTETMLSEILSDVIAEADVVPTSVLESILQRFVDDSKVGKTAGLELTVSLCKSNSDRLSRQVTQYFSEQLCEGHLTKTHKLFIHIWRQCPQLLTSAMGVLENELEAEDENIRCVATKTIGHILCSPNKNLVVHHPEIFTEWRRKTLDISPQVRGCWVESSVEALKERDDTNGEITTGLTKCLLDTDEKVRLVTCRVMSELSPKLILNKFENQDFFHSLTQLIRERQPEIREFSIKILCKLFDAFPEKFKEVPGCILSLVYINDPGVNASVDTVLCEYVLPLERDAHKRVQRLLYVVENLEAKPKNAFWAILKRQRESAKNVLHIEDDAKQTKIFNWLAVSFPNPVSAESHFQKFAEIHNKRLFRLLKLCASPDSDYDTVRNSISEFLGKIDKQLAPTFRLLLYRISMLHLNKSNFSEIVSSNSVAAKEILKLTSSLVPSILNTHIHTLMAKRDTTSLVAVYHFFKDSCIEDSAFFGQLQEICLDGTPLQAKYAMKIISCSKFKDSFLNDVSKRVLPIEGAANLVTRIALLSQLFISDEELVEPEAGHVTAFLIKDILLTNQNKNVKRSEGWISDADLESGQFDECYAKMFALDFFVNRLRSLEKDPLRGPIADSVFKLLVSLIGNGGEIAPKNPTPLNVQSRLRLKAGLCLLKLAKLPVYSALITPRMVNSLVFLVQDEEEVVRSLFISKLKRYLKQEAISERFLSLIFFVAHEPCDPLLSDTKTWVRSNVKTTSFERSLVRLIHMLAHHQEFLDLIAQPDQTLQAFSFALEYICFFLELVANSENVSLLYYLAARVKQYKDTLSDSDNVYMISDLAQAAIQEVVSQRSWNIVTWPGKVDLSADLFCPLQDSVRAHEIVSSSFMPTDIAERVAQVLRSKISGKRHRNTVTKRKREIKVAEPSRKSSRSTKKISYME